MLGVPHPTVHIPSWPPSDDPAVYINSPLFSVNSNPDFDSDSESDSELYSSDYFRMYEFKVRKCMRARSHDWTECPFAHPGEKARRRDPRKYSYSGTACPDFRKGSCQKGESCEYAHGVFECWLHPSRYRTQPCKDGLGCKRRVCFFAHSVEQLRVASPGAVLGLSNSVDGSPPMSPVSEVVRSVRSLQLSRMNSFPAQLWNKGGVFGLAGPSTPTRGYGFGNVFEEGEEEEPVMERVESGRDLRMKMFERILSGSGC